LDFDVTLPFPTPPESLRDVIFDKEEDKAEYNSIKDTRYGLYAIIVHSGLRLDGGHYFAYAREADKETDLTVEDNKENAPWMKYDDKKVIPITWREIRENLRTSLSQTAYMLFYRRILPKSNEEKKMSRSTGIVAPILPEIVAKDNREYLIREVRQQSPHFLQELNALARYKAKYANEFIVSLPVDQESPTTPKSPSSSSSSSSTSSISSDLCSLCFASLSSPSHKEAQSLYSGVVNPCPFLGSQVVQCEKCKLQLPRVLKEQHICTFAPPSLLTSTGSVYRPSTS